MLVEVMPLPALGCKQQVLQELLYSPSVAP